MTKLIFSTFFAALALASSAANNIRASHLSQASDAEAKPEPDEARISSITTVASVNTYVTRNADTFGASVPLEVDECYYLPNLVAQVSWVKPTDDNFQYVGE